MAKRGRERGRHYSTRAKINLILSKPRMLLLYFVLIIFIAGRNGIWAYFSDIDSLLNEFSIDAMYVVTFAPNGGQGTMANQNISFNFPTPLRENSYTKDGYLFNGWNSKADGTGTPYQDEQLVLNSDFPDVDNILLYAQWTPATNAVAMTNGVYYDTLQEAINAVPNDNTPTTVTLLKDVSENLTVNSGKNIVFDLQNYTISNNNDPIFEVYGTVTFQNGTIYNTSNNAGAVNVYPNAVLYVTGGEIISTAEKGKQAIFNTGGTVYISGGYIENACKPGVAANDKLRGAVHNKDGYMYVTGGTIVAKHFVGLQNEAELTIGVQDNDPDLSKPVIQGGTYGLSNTIVGSQQSTPDQTSNHFTYMYNGVIKGKTASIDDESLITGTETGYVIAHYGETIDEQVYIVAHLGTETKTVTFDPNGGQVIEQTRTVETNHTIGSLPIPIYTNKEFDGWYTLQTGGTEITDTTIITSDITIHAHWKNPVACISNGVEYPSINAAISAAHPNRETTITVVKDIELFVADKITVQNNRKIILDLDGHTIKNKAGETLPLIESQGTLEIVGGTLKTDTSQGAINVPKGTVTINGTTIEATGTRQAVYVDKGKAIITGGAVLSSTSTERATVQTLANGTVDILDATITSTGYSAVANAGTLNIGSHDGNINISTPTIVGNDYGVNRTGGTVNFYDGTIKGKTGSINGTVSNIENHSQRKVDFEMIDGIMYVIEYLIPD